MSSQVVGVVLTKNEEHDLGRCLASLQWCDQILVVDDYSTDQTEYVARRWKARIVKHHLKNDFAQQRNFALTYLKARLYGESRALSGQPWVLFVDADEEVPADLASEIKRRIDKESFMAYLSKRRDIFFGKKLSFGETAHWNQIRLAKLDAGQWRGKVHEVWEISSGSIGQLKPPLIHHAHDQMTNFLSKINIYSTMAAEEFWHQGNKSFWWQIIAYPVAKFIQNYFWRLGLLDGPHGFVHATCMSFHSFLVRGKLYLLTRRVKSHDEN